MEIKKVEKQQQKTKRIFNVASSLTNFEIQKYYQNQPKFNGVYSRDSLPKIKEKMCIKMYVINVCNKS